MGNSLNKISKAIIEINRKESKRTLKRILCPECKQRTLFKYYVEHKFWICPHCKYTTEHLETLQDRFPIPSTKINLNKDYSNKNEKK